MVDPGNKTHEDYMEKKPYNQGCLEKSEGRHEQLDG